MKATRICIPIQAPLGQGSATFDVVQDFETVTQQLMPDEQPNTPDGVRTNLTFQDARTGRNVFIVPPQANFWIAEVEIDEP